MQMNMDDELLLKWWKIIKFFFFVLTDSINGYDGPQYGKNKTTTKKKYINE